MDDLSAAKAELRAPLRRSRAALPAELRRAWSSAIAARVASFRPWQAATTAQLFIGALPGEVETLGLARICLAAGKALVCPRVAGPDLELRRVSDLDQLVPGPFGLLEPDPTRTEVVEPAEVDLFLLPGLAFDRAGGRLGLGRGYYDRLLAKSTAIRVGLGYDMQVLDAVPMTGSDRRVDAIVTELRVIWCSRGPVGSERLKERSMTLDVQVVQLPTQFLAAFREQVATADLAEAFARMFPGAYEQMQREGAPEMGVPTAVYHSMDSERADMSAGLEVGAGYAPEPPLAVLELPAGEAAKVDYYGPYEALSTAYEAIMAWSAENGRELSAEPRERYLTDPGAEPDPAKWLTEVIWPLK